MKNHISKIAPAILAIIFLASACDTSNLTSDETDLDNSLSPVLAKKNKNAQPSVGDVEITAALLSDINVQLAANDMNFRAFKAEYITDASNNEMGNTVIAKDVGNKQLDTDFVPNDERRNWSGPIGGTTDNITFAIDQTGDAIPPFGGLSGAETTAAIQRAMGTWDERTCSDLAITQNGDFGFDIGLVAFLNGLGGSPFVFGDIQHAGWRDIDFAGGVLGVAFTFTFIDGDGNPTDIDDDGRADVAFREIYYDPSFNWADDGSSNVDVETVALHEAGHGLSQAHFGKVFIKKNGSVKAAPRAVMNASYLGPLPVLQGTDNGGHCSNWANWPSN